MSSEELTLKALERLEDALGDDNVPSAVSKGLRTAVNDYFSKSPNGETFLAALTNVARHFRSTSPKTDDTTNNDWDYLPFGDPAEVVEHTLPGEVLRIARDLHGIWAKTAEGWEEHEFEQSVIGNLPTVWAFTNILNGNSRQLNALASRFKLRASGKPCHSDYLDLAFEAQHYSAELACRVFPQLRTKEPLRLYRFCHSIGDRVQFMVFRPSSASARYMEKYAAEHETGKLQLVVLDIEVGVPLLPTVIFFKQRHRLKEFEVLLPPDTLASYSRRSEATMNTLKMKLSKRLSALLRAYYTVRPLVPASVEKPSAAAGSGKK